MVDLWSEAVSTAGRWVQGDYKVRGTGLTVGYWMNCQRHRVNSRMVDVQVEEHVVNSRR